LSIIAVRRSLQGQIVFFKQELNHVYYSFDRAQWFYGWTIPPSGSAGDNYWDLSKEIDEIIEEYNNHYTQNTNINVIINNFQIPANRTQALDQIAEMTNQIYSDRKLCKAIIYLLTVARNLGLAVQNGQLEPDDADRAGEFANAVIPVVGGFIAGFLDLASPDVKSMASITDEQLEDYACCIYNSLQGGNFSYAGFVTAGTACGLGAWDEIATPEMYAFMCALLANDPLTGKCPCEDCVVANGSSAEVSQGVVKGKALLTGSVQTAVGVFEMQARGIFRFPLMTVTRVEVWYATKPYENTTSSLPLIRFDAPNTGGGNTAIIPNTVSAIAIPAIQLPQVPVDYIELNLRSSVCASCTTAQTATYNESYGAILLVKICGNLA